jgi:hypothetical protein
MVARAVSHQHCLPCLYTDRTESHYLRLGFTTLVHGSCVADPRRIPSDRAETVSGIDGWRPLIAGLLMRQAQPDQDSGHRIRENTKVVLI